MDELKNKTWSKTNQHNLVCGIMDLGHFTVALLLIYWLNDPSTQINKYM